MTPNDGWFRDVGTCPSCGGKLGDLTPDEYYVFLCPFCDAELIPVERYPWLYLIGGYASGALVAYLGHPRDGLFFSFQTLFYGLVFTLTFKGLAWNLRLPRKWVLKQWPPLSILTPRSKKSTEEQVPPSDCSPK
jgi:hypothetical protein